MRYERLKNMKCPNCNGQLARSLMYRKYSCTKCNFGITDEQFNATVHGLYNPKGRMKFTQDNSHALNNLGHDEMTEGFISSDDKI